jgi:hypothetical protein
VKDETFEEWSDTHDRILRMSVNKYDRLASTLMRLAGMERDDLLQELRIRIILNFRRGVPKHLALATIIDMIVRRDLMDMLDTANKKSLVPRDALVSMDISEQEDSLPLGNSLIDYSTDVEQEAIMSYIKQELRQALQQHHQERVVDAFLWCIENEEKHIPGKLPYITFYGVQRNARRILERLVYPNPNQENDHGQP